MAEDNAVVSAKEKKHSVKDLGAAGTEFLRNHKHIYTRHRKKILVFFLCIVAVILWVLVFNLRKYDDFDVKETYERVDSAETHYVDFQDNFLKYSRDGAFYTEYDGDLIWNYTYEMDDPQIDVCGNYILIYDVQGTQAAILTNTGFKQTIKTAMPIVDANIASQGTVAILMQDGEAGYVQICNDAGKVLASGELHMKNSGYPLAIALSSTAQRLMVSQLDVKDGNVKTTISFYDFSNKGKDEIDNIVATYSFSDQIIPQIAYVDGDKAIAFGDSEVIVFNNNSKASIAKETFVDGQIKSVFYDDKYWGIICQATDDEGKYIDQMTVYTLTGRKRCQKTIDIASTNAEFVANHEIVLSNNKEVELYTLQGIKKFADEFSTSIYKIIPQDASRRYVFVEDGHTDVVRLK